MEHHTPMISSTVKKCIFISVILYVSTTNLADSVISDAEDKITFLKGQDIVLVTDRADVILDISLGRIYAEIRKVCRYSNVAKNISLSGLITNRFLDLCHDLYAEWYRVRDLFGFKDESTEDADSKDQRGIITTIASFVIGGITEEIWGDDHSSEAIAALQEDSDNLNRAFREEDTRVSMNADHIHELTKIIRSDEHRQAVQTFKEMAAIGVLALFEVAGRDADRILNGLRTLAQTSVLSADLLAKGALSSIMEDVASKAKDKGLILAVETELELLRRPVSFAALKDGSVRVVLHVPLAEPDLIFETWTYVPAPTSVLNSSLSIVVDPTPLTVLAMDHKQNVYFELPSFPGDKTRRALMDVEEVNLRRDFRATCLTALMASSPRAVRAKCRGRSPPMIPRFWRLEDDTVLVFQPFPRTLKVACRGRPVAEEHFKGKRTVHLRPGCRATTEDLLIITSRTSVGGTLRYTAGHPGLSYDDLTVSKRLNESDLLAHLLQSEAEVEVHSPHLPPPRSRTSSRSGSNWTWSTTAGAFAACIFAVLAIYCCLRRRKCCALWQRRARSRGASRHRQRSRTPSIERSTPYDTWTACPCALCKNNHRLRHRSRSSSPSPRPRHCQAWSPMPPTLPVPIPLLDRTGTRNRRDQEITTTRGSTGALWTSTPRSRPLPTTPREVSPRPSGTSPRRASPTSTTSSTLSRTNPWIEMRDVTTPLTSRAEEIRSRATFPRRTGRKWLLGAEDGQDSAPRTPAPRCQPPQEASRCSGASARTPPPMRQDGTQEAPPLPTQPHPEVDGVHGEDEEAYQAMFPAFRFAVNRTVNN